MSNPLIFNRATDNYLFTIAEARGLSGERLRLRSSNSAAIIDICNNGVIDISASATDISSTLQVAGAANLSSTLETTGQITANGGIEVSGNVLPANNNSYIPVTYNTFAVKNSDSVLVDRLSDSSNTWLEATDYDLSINLLSQNSAVKMEFKVNYRASPEAEQYISFKVEDTSGSRLVFQDCSLGSIMGVTTSSVYNGTFIDTTPSSTNPTYQLHYYLDCPAGDSIDTQFGILGGSTHSNYISLQELYKLS